MTCMTTQQQIPVSALLVRQYIDLNKTLATLQEEQKRLGRRYFGGAGVHADRVLRLKNEIRASIATRNEMATRLLKSFSWDVTKMLEPVPFEKELHEALSL
jgi:hypothetical protein